MLNSTKCLCGRELAGKKFDKYIPEPMNDKFYGGRVSMTGTIKCECGRDLKGFFQRVSNNLVLIDLEIVKDLEEPLQLDSEEQSTYIPITYEEMTYKELQDIAREKGIKVAGAKREEIISKLEEIS